MTPANPQESSGKSDHFKPYSGVFWAARRSAATFGKIY